MGLLQSCLRLFALGDIANRAGDEHAVLGLEQTQANLNRKFASILAQTVQAEIHAHGAGLRLSVVSCPVPHMRIPVAGRHQYLDRLSEQFLVGVAK